MKQYADDLRSYAEILRPSTLSGLVGSILSVIAVLLLTFPRLLSLYGLGEYIQYMRDQPDDLWLRYQDAGMALNSSELAANFSVFVVWSITGLIAYALVAACINAVKGVIEFEHDVEYFRYGRGMIVREALIHVLIRIIALFLILGLYVLSVNIVIPAVTSAVQTGFGAPVVLMITYYLAAIIAIMLTLHAGVVLIRLLLLRTRVFYGHYYVAK